MLHLFKSNRIDSLLEALTTLTRTGPKGPFDFDLICAPDSIHERMKVALATAHGVFAGEIVSPRNAVEQIISRVTMVPDARLPHQGDAVMFFMSRVILELLETPAFVPVKRYLGTPFNLQKVLALAGALAGLYGEYAIYRPMMLAEWQRHADDWQSILMAKVADTFVPHVGEGALQAMAALQRDDGTAAEVPRRVIVFGVSSLPPVFLDLLAATSVRTEVYLFVVTPSQDYFESSKPRRLENNTVDGAQNSLLALMGAQPSMFQDALVSVASQVPVMETDLFGDAFSDTVLGRIQFGVQRNQLAPRSEKVTAVPSVQFHQCTGIGREVDVMVASVLQQIMEHDVAPGDILVMAPDINVYAPWIEAAMMHTGVPFTISDRSMCSSPGAPEAMAVLLQLVDSRLTLQDVFALLNMAPVRGRFDLDDTDVHSAWKWCQAARIRACIDAAHREYLGLEPFAENTWRFGLNRLLLGIAIENDADVYSGVSPVAGYFGTETVTLGRVLGFLETLFSLVESCHADRNVSEWCALFDQQLTAFLTPVADGLGAIRSVFQGLSEQAELVEFTRDIDFVAFKTILKGRVDRSLFTSGSGQGVRFSSFRFLRGETVSVVALLGMDEGNFPNDNRAPSFDRIAAQPRPGDRDLRNEGYHMFLEAVMAASRRLLVFYGGISEQTGQPSKPCVPVRELQAVVSEVIDGAGNNAGEAPIHLSHPALSHAPEYFDPAFPEFVNYQRSDFQAALAMRKQASVQPGMQKGAIVGDSTDIIFARPTEIPDDMVTLLLNEFIRFWQNPAQFYLMHTLGLTFVDPADDASVDEPLELKGLDEWEIGQRFVDGLLAERNWDEMLPIVRALGIAPVGNLGEFYASRVFEQARGIAVAVANQKAMERRDELPVDVIVESAQGPLRILGTIPVFEGGVFDYSYSKVRSDKRLSLMLKYLVVQTQASRDSTTLFGTPAMLIGRDEARRQTVRCEIAMETSAVSATLSNIAGWTILGMQKPLVFSVPEGFDFARRVAKMDEESKKAFLNQSIVNLTRMMQHGAPPLARALLDTGVIRQQDAAGEFEQIVSQVVSPLLASIREERL